MKKKYDRVPYIKTDHSFWSTSNNFNMVPLFGSIFYWDPEDNIKTKSFSICRENIYEIYLGLKWAAIECKKGRMLASLSYRGAEGNGVYLRLPSSIPTNDIALFTIPEM